MGKVWQDSLDIILHGQRYILYIRGTHRMMQKEALAIHMHNIIFHAIVIQLHYAAQKIISLVLKCSK